MSGPAPAPQTGRAPRRDALRNDRIVIDAARAVFAEHGPHASMEAIAARAGVGVGTIYRRFAGKDELLDAIARLFAEEMDAAATAALEDPDPRSGLEGFLEFIGTFNAEKRRYAATLTDRTVDETVSTATIDKVRQLTRRCIDAGVLAPHTTADDVKALIVAIRSIVAVSPESDNASWRRFLRTHLAGLYARDGLSK